MPQSKKISVEFQGEIKTLEGFTLGDDVEYRVSAHFQSKSKWIKGKVIDFSVGGRIVVKLEGMPSPNIRTVKHDRLRKVVA